MTHDDLRTSSYLLRFWQEPQQGTGPPAFRCYLRELRTGREIYVDDPGKLGEQMLRPLSDSAAADGSGGRD